MNFNASSGKSENLHFDVLHLSKVYYLYYYRGVMCHNTEEWCKIWGGTDLCCKKWHEEFGEFDPTFESLKICTLMGSFWTRYIMFELKNYRGVMCHDTDEWCNIQRKLTGGLKNGIRNLINFHASSCKSENLHLDGLVLSKTYKVLDEKVMSRDTEEWSKEKLILEKYAFFVWCNRLEAVSGRYS